MIERSEVGGLTWSPYPAEARLLLAVVLTHQGLLDEAWDLLDVSGQNPPMVYEWLFFAHQMLITIGIRGRRKEHALERLRDYWGTDGLTAISSGGAEIMRADDRRRRVRRGVGLRRRGGGGRAAVARVVPGAAAARDPHPGRARRCGAAPVGRGARVGGPRRRAPDGRRRPGDRLLRALRRQPRPGVPHVGGPPHRRAPALALAGAGRPALGRRAVAAWRAAEETAVAYASVPEVAQTRVRLAGVLRAVGDAAGARTVADQARRRPTPRRPTDARRAPPPRGPRPRPPPAPRRRRSHRGRGRSSRSSRRGAPTARSASSSSSAPRPCRSTCPTSWPSSRLHRAPRPPRWPVAAACSETRPRRAFVGPARG